MLKKIKIPCRNSCWLMFKPTIEECQKVGCLNYIEYLSSIKVQAETAFAVIDRVRLEAQVFRNLDGILDCLEYDLKLDGIERSESEGKC